MKYVELKYVAVEYKHGWSLWIEREGKKVMLGSAIKNEEELDKLVSSLKVEKEYFREKVDAEKEQLKQKVKELEEYKFKFDLLSKTLNSINETTKMTEKASYSAPCVGSFNPNF